MKKYTQIILFNIFIICISFTSFAQTSFEGKIKFKMTYEDEVTHMDYFIKGENFRIEVEENEQGVFIKNAEQTIILMPEEKMYMDINKSVLSKLPDMGGTQQGNDEEAEQINIENYKTGKTKTILGYECHQWIFTDEEEGDEVEAWVTDELGNFMFMQNPMGAGYSPGWGSSVQNNGFFPILVITRENGGDEISRFEATEIDKKSLNNDLFAPPSNYTEMKIPGMDSFFK